MNISSAKNPHQAVNASKRPPAAATTSYRQTAMKDWIDGAIRSLGEKKNNGCHAGGSIICSKEYLSCAFVIAHSLADQLCAREEHRSYHYSREEGNNIPHLNRNESSWSNSIYINCGVKNSVGEEAKGEAQYGAFESDPRAEGGDFDDFDILAKQLADILDPDRQPTDYLKIEGAILIDKVADSSSVMHDEKGEIYSLGEVFYELFSGGQHFRDTGMPQKSHPSSQSLPLEKTTAAEREGRKSSRSWTSDYGTIDKYELKTAMELIDEIGEDDELFGSAFSKETKTDGALKNPPDSEQQIDQGYSQQRQRSRRKSDSFAIGGPLQKTFRSASPRSRSVEPLRSLALPTSLCNLISNMIESTNNGGNIQGDDHDTYKSMADVRDDLKMLMDTPELYLRDIDIINASNIGLQFEYIGDRDRHTPLCGREMELEALKESYHRSISSGSEVAMICGPSGIGKSKLSEEFAAYFSSQSAPGCDCIFLSAGFDKMQQTQPFKAIGSAFDKYFLWLSSRDQNTVKKFSSALIEELKGDAKSLVTVMPNLSTTLGNDCRCEDGEVEDNTAVDAQKRLRYLFCQFVGVISRCHEEPLILFLDDCQWIDAASVALLNHILVMPGASTKDRRLFFYCCCRDDEMNETHPFPQMLSSLGSFGIKTSKIILTPMAEDTVNEMVSTTLSLLPRLTRPLGSILYRKTKGSPIFIKQLLVELSKQRILYPSLTRRRWLWESDKIRDMEIPGDVHHFIQNSFNRLPSEVLNALCVLSCFGASADIHLLQKLETEMKQPLIELLDKAVTASVLGKMNGKFFFVHDKLQEAAYNVINEEVRCTEHFKYGLALSHVANREKDDKLLMTAVEQMNYGGPQAVADGEQGIAVARMNLNAGKIAMKMSDFLSAFSFFDGGISYLRKGHWDYHYDMTLELFNLATKCAFINGEYECLRILTQQIIRYAKCFEDKCQAISVSISLLSWSVNVPEAIKLLNHALKSLGEDLPPSITEDYVQDYLKSTTEKLSDLSDLSLMSYPLMVDASKIIAMELFVKLHENLTFSGDTTSLPLIPLKMIQLSLLHGMNPLSPVGFAQYGNYLALVKQDFEEGYRYAKFASSLMKQMPSRAHDGAIIYYSTHTKLTVEPIQSAVENYRQAYIAAMKSGATKYAIASCYLYDSFIFWSGKNLNSVVESMKVTMKRMKYHKSVLTRALLLPMFQVAMRLIGSTISHQSYMSDDETREEGDVISNITSVSAVTCVAKLNESLVFREFNKAKDCLEKMFDVPNLSGFNMSAPTFQRIFYSGLVSFWVGREMDDKKWTDKGVESKVAIEKMVESASAWNFLNKAQLLQAEEQFCDRNYEEAERLYDAAILSSKEHMFLNEEALANELAGHFYLETGRRNKSLHYFSQAIAKYNEWGAIAKANMLAKYLDGNGSVSVPVMQPVPTLS